MIPNSNKNFLIAVITIVKFFLVIVPPYNILLTCFIVLPRYIVAALLIITTNETGRYLTQYVTWQPVLVLFILE